MYTTVVMQGIEILCDAGKNFKKTEKAFQRGDYNVDIAKYKEAINTLKSETERALYWINSGLKEPNNSIK